MLVSFSESGYKVQSFSDFRLADIGMAQSDATSYLHAGCSMLPGSLVKPSSSYDHKIWDMK